MSHECHEGACSSEHHSQTHGCCGSSEYQCCCPCHSQHHKYSEDLLELADEAWMEVIKEKIKDEIRLHSGEHISQLAKIVSQTNHARWLNFIDKKNNIEEYESRLRELAHCHHSK